MSFFFTRKKGCILLNPSRKIKGADNTIHALYFQLTKSKTNRDLKIFFRQDVSYDRDYQRTMPLFPTQVQKDICA